MDLLNVPKPQQERLLRSRALLNFFLVTKKFNKSVYDFQVEDGAGIEFKFGGRKDAWAGLFNH